MGCPHHIQQVLSTTSMLAFLKLEGRSSSEIWLTIRRHPDKFYAVTARCVNEYGRGKWRDMGCVCGRGRHWEKYTEVRTV